MHKTAKSLELVEVELYSCYIIFSYLFLHKTLILRNVICRFFYSLLYTSTLLLLFIFYIVITFIYITDNFILSKI